MRLSSTPPTPQRPCSQQACLPVTCSGCVCLSACAAIGSRDPRARTRTGEETRGGSADQPINMRLFYASTNRILPPWRGGNQSNCCSEKTQGEKRVTSAVLETTNEMNHLSRLTRNYGEKQLKIHSCVLKIRSCFLTIHSCFRRFILAFLKIHSCLLKSHSCILEINSCVLKIHSCFLKIHSYFSKIHSCF